MNIRGEIAVSGGYRTFAKRSQSDTSTMGSEKPALGYFWSTKVSIKNIYKQLHLPRVMFLTFSSFISLVLSFLA